MANNETHKNNRIISFDKLTDELKEQFAEAYPQPDGYDPYLKKIIKPDGTPIFVVPFETDDTVYMVKFEVKIDSPMAEDELEKDLFGDSGKGGEMSDMDIIEQNDNGEKDESHREFTLNHGNYAEEAAMADATSDNAFGSDDDEEEEEDDPVEDLDPDDDDLLDDELEPDEEELLDIELELMASEKEQEKAKGDKKDKKTAPKTTKKETKTTEKKPSKPAKETKKSTTKTTKAAKEAAPKAKKETKKSK
ncbi:MAG: hypothetical protein IJQ89_02555 [Bacteroidales bacterium]|nr:hypothetical protein [Bacteroidales bacterium]